MWLFCLTGIHRKAHAPSYSEMEWVKRWRQRSVPFVGGKIVLQIFFFGWDSYFKNGDVLRNLFLFLILVPVFSGHSTTERLPALLWTSLPALCHPGSEEPRSSHGQWRINSHSLVSFWFIPQILMFSFCSCCRCITSTLTSTRPLIKTSWLWPLICSAVWRRDSELM